jgi:hypothetical protein
LKLNVSGFAEKEANKIWGFISKDINSTKNKPMEENDKRKYLKITLTDIIAGILSQTSANLLK